MRKSLLIFVAILGLAFHLPMASAETSMTYVYDTNGNLISGDGKYYEYNDANKLIKVRHGDASGAVIAEYFYDYNGQRIKKIENGETTYYIGKLYVQQVSETGQTTNTSYYFADSERVAKKDSSGNISYYNSDHLAGTNVVTSSNGSLIERTSYYPFGEIREGGSEQYTYTGKEQDDLTDWYYFEARYYDPEIMRFTQADWITLNVYDPQTLNRYSYVKNNPLKYIDPSGNLELPIWLTNWRNPLSWLMQSQNLSYTQNQSSAVKTTNNNFGSNVNSIDFSKYYSQGHQFYKNDGPDELGGQCGWFAQQITNVGKYGEMGDTLQNKQKLISGNIGNGAFYVGEKEIKAGYVIITDEGLTGHVAVVNEVTDGLLKLTESNYYVDDPKSKYYGYKLKVNHERTIKSNSIRIKGVLEASPK